MIQRTSKILVAVALGAVAFAAQDGVVLKRDLSPSKTSYTTATKTTQVVQLPNGMGEQEMIFNISSDNTIEVTGVDAEGWASVVDTTSNFKMAADGPMAGMMGDMSSATPSTYKTMYKMNAFGKVKDIQFDGITKEQQDMMSGFGNTTMSAFELPDRPLKIGDTFTIPVPKSPMFGNKEQTLTVTLSGETEVAGRKAWVLKAAGPLQVESDLSQMMGAGGAGMSMVMKGVMNMATETWVEKSTGITLGSKTTATSNMKMELPDMGMSLDIKGSVNSETKLKE